MMKGPFRRIVALIPCLLIAIALFSLTASAQSGSQGTVVVTVNDPTGAVIPEAALTLVAQRTNDLRTAQTSKNGITLLSVSPSVPTN